MKGLKFDMTVYEELKARGLIAQVTDEEEICELINAGKATFYWGFDVTADSLHVGHFMALNMMRRLQLAGNRPIALVGGGTTMVGDPSGRTEARPMLTTDEIQHNADCIKLQMEKFLDFSEDKAIMVNNADWLLGLNYVELLREVGAHFSVNRMMSFESMKSRMEKGLSFLEFNYIIMQSYDFFHLFKEYACQLQCGGDDQWSNILSGTELIRKKLGKNAYGLTITLLLTSTGTKMGKTSEGAVWLDPNRTTPFEFYQYWRNVEDSDVINCLRMLTYVPLDEIDGMSKWEGSKLNEAKELLAYELTKLVHSEVDAENAQNTSRELFATGGAKDMPTTTLGPSDLTEGVIDILTLLQKSGLCPSKSEARRAINQGGVEVDGEKITEFGVSFGMDQLRGEGIVMRRGKKNYNKIIYVD